MVGLRWVVVLLGAVLGGWLTLDGTRALTVGDYMTPRAGEHAGQLGPWSQWVTALGMDPRSTFVKSAHVVLGLLWLTAAVGYACGAAGSGWAVLGCAVASLWYLPLGTLIGVLEIGLLMVLRGE